MNGNTDKVVFGTMEDCMSFEAPCVIYINIGIDDIIYPLLSRARTRLTLITSFLLPPFNQIGTLVTWMEENGHFVKK